jgi:hypothetical protein
LSSREFWSPFTSIAITFFSRLPSWQNKVLFPLVHTVCIYWLLPVLSKIVGSSPLVGEKKWDARRMRDTHRSICQQSQDACFPFFFWRNRWCYSQTDGPVMLAYQGTVAALAGILSLSLFCWSAVAICQSNVKDTPFDLLISPPTRLLYHGSWRERGGVDGGCSVVSRCGTLDALVCGYQYCLRLQLLCLSSLSCS